MNVLKQGFAEDVGDGYFIVYADAARTNMEVFPIGVDVGVKFFESCFIVG